MKKNNEKELRLSERSLLSLSTHTKEIEDGRGIRHRPARFCKQSIKEVLATLSVQLGCKPSDRLLHVKRQRTDGFLPK